MYQRGMGSEIGRSYDGHWLTKTPVTHALDNIRKGFEYTSIEPPVKIGNSLTIEECNILHRVFTTKIKDKRYDRLDLQLINHGVHEYEQSLVTPNYMNFSTRNGINDCILGFDTMDNTETMSKYFFNIDEEYGYMSADVYLNDECRVGRSYEEAWAQDDNPSNSDIMNIDGVGPLFIFQNERRKKLYSSDSFLNWIGKYNITEKEYADVPFANIVDGNYGNTATATLVEITC